MTTPKETPEQEIPSNSSTPIEDAVAILLDLYEPVLVKTEADKFFSTNAIISSLEMHYGVPQGNLDYHTADAGVRVIKKMTELGYKYVNTGGLQLEWMLKRKAK